MREQARILIQQDKRSRIIEEYIQQHSQAIMEESHKQYQADCYDERLPRDRQRTMDPYRKETTEILEEEMRPGLEAKIREEIWPKLRIG